MLDAMRSADHVTRSMRSRAKAIAEAEAAAGRGLSEADLAAVTGLTRRQVRDTLAQVAGRPVSFDAESHDVAGGGDTESDVVVAEVLAAAAKTQDALDAETQVVLALRFHRGLDFAQIAERLGITEARVVALHDAGVLAVHAVMLKAVTLTVSTA